MPKGVRLATALLATAALLVPARAEDPTVGELRLAVSNLESKAGAAAGRLPARSRSSLDAAIAKLRGRQNELASLDAELENEKSELDSEETHVQRLRIEWESALSRYEQRNQRFEAELAAHREEGERLDAQTEAHNARDPESMTESELERWNEEARLGNLRVERWNTRSEEFITKDGKEVLDLRLEASRRERLHVEAKAAYDRKKMEIGSRRSEVQAGAASALADAAGLASALDSVSRPATRPSEGMRPIPAPSHPAGTQVHRLIRAAEQEGGGAPSDLARHVYVVGPARTPSPGAAPDLRLDLLAGAVRDDLRRYGRGRPILVEEPEDVPKPVDSTVFVRPDPEPPEDARPPTQPDDAVVDTSLTVSPSVLALARSHHGRLSRKIDALHGELARVRSRREKHREDRKPFEEEIERALSIHGIAGDLLGVVPWRHFSDGLRKSKEVAALVQAKKLEIIDAGFAAAKGLNDAMKDGAGETDVAEVRRELGALLAAEEAAEEILTSLPPGHPTRKAVDGVRKLMATMAVAQQFIEQQDSTDGRRTWGEVLGDGARLGIDLGATFNPLIGSAKAVESLGERAVTWYVVQPAIQSLGGAIAKDYEAERFLEERIQRLDEMRYEQERVIDMAADHGVGGASAVRDD